MITLGVLLIVGSGSYFLGRKHGKSKVIKEQESAMKKMIEHTLNIKQMTSETFDSYRERARKMITKL